MPDDDSPYDVVGNRVLVGVQMVNISRLSTHPVPITTSGLITVAGQGPTDSNGAGKSSFIAGLSLLHADDQWRLQSGAQAAAELLFTAELAGQEAMHANADRGYVIGVFAPPDAATAEALEAAALTVWLRINRQSPHVELRWATRLHVPYGETENERAAGADELWNGLPKSNGRTDLRANRLAKTLYGNTVRCVSFLSTSVRASLTANLLAQPLNELSPERIFDAIGALTGLTGELEQEQKARSLEHGHATAASQAREQYEEWDTRMAAVEAGIRTRQEARALLEQAQATWRSRCARDLVDGLTEDEQLADDLQTNEREREDLAAEIEQAESELSRLTDDVAFNRGYQERVHAYNAVKAEVDALQKGHSQTVGQIEALARQRRELEERAQAADGLDADQAAHERHVSEMALAAAQRAKGVADAELRSAAKALAAAERGDDVAADQVRALRARGIETVPLVDAVELDEAARAVWEARLLPYRNAVVVRHEDGATAAEALAGMPGSIVVCGEVAKFKATLAARAGEEAPLIDADLGVLAISGFREPLTGRAGRIRQARATHEAAAEADSAADAAVTTAERNVQRAREREDAAVAGARAVELDALIERLRAENDANEAERDKLAPALARASETYQLALTDKAARDTRVGFIRDTIKGLERDQAAILERWSELTARREGLDLAARHTAWGGTVDAAHQHLLGLEQQLSPAEWDDAADDLAERTRRKCFPAGTPMEELPEELRLLDEQRGGRRSQERIRLIPALLRITDTYLAQHARVDSQQLTEIEAQRAEKIRTLGSAETALVEARQASAALRATLATAIKAKLKQVSAEFDRIDKAYGGYGGTLDYPEPEPPADPDKPWRWSVTPKWRRSEGKAPASYRLRGNTAQMDDKAVKLVCAAALAGTEDRPLLLVLDELGRNLGAAHRRDAVALFENIGRDRAISVVGALQDDMERYAIGASSLYIKLRRTSDTMPYNQAPVIIGNDLNKARVELLTDWLTSFRA